MKQVFLRIPQRAMMLLFGLMLSVGTFAQITVNGLVKDATGETVIGATVRVVGEQGGTVTDFDGKFVLKCAEGAELQISSVGYQTATVKAKENLIVVLQDDAALLNEVVVIGYGVAKKNDLTGSVTAMKPDAKNKGLVVNAQDMIQGKIAGVSVTNAGGSPNSGSQIIIRGISSINNSQSNEPLFILDGVPVNGGAAAAADINPNDIENINGACIKRRNSYFSRHLNSLLCSK